MVCEVGNNTFVGSLRLFSAMDRMTILCNPPLQWQPPRPQTEDKLEHFHLKSLHLGAIIQKQNFDHLYLHTQRLVPKHNSFSFLINEPKGIISEVIIGLEPDFSTDPTKSQFRTGRVGARRRDVVFAQIHIHQTSPHLLAAPRRHTAPVHLCTGACTSPCTCSQTCNMNGNLSSSLRLY